MLAFTIHDTKAMMGHLLKGELFDSFLLRQGEIHTFATFHIDGTKDERFQAEGQTDPYCTWAEAKPFFFEAIKGKILPKSMKIVLTLTPERTAHYPNASAVFLNLLYREGALLATTAISEETFSLERIGQQKWDEDILKFFKKHEIAVQLDA